MLSLFEIGPVGLGTNTDGRTMGEGYFAREILRFQSCSEEGESHVFCLNSQQK